MNTETLDRQRVEALLVKILKPIRDNYLTGPISQARVFEALNALAAAAAGVIRGAEESRGCGTDTKPEEFFRQALDNHLLDQE